MCIKREDRIKTTKIDIIDTRISLSMTFDYEENINAI